MSRMPWAGQTVLIVDDSEMARNHLRALYQELGMVVKGSAVNGVDALSKLDDLQADLVSLDINMPEMDGVECYKKIKERMPSQRIAMISWLASDQRLVDALGGVIPPHLFQSKPITLDGLKGLLERVHGLAEQAPRDTLDITTAALEMPTYTHKVS